jgi:hypothetical protein
MISELSGILISGGILLAASSIVATTHEEPSTPPTVNADEAMEIFNESLASANSNTLTLAPALSYQPYEKLSTALADIGIGSIYSASRLGLDVNLSRLLPPESTFTEERNLFADMVKEGLMMSPGEANGLTVPGHFIISSPFAADDEVVSEIVTRLGKVLNARSSTSQAAKNLLEQYNKVKNNRNGEHKRKESAAANTDGPIKKAKK